MRITRVKFAESITGIERKKMKRETIGTYPYQIGRENNNLIMRFFPKIPQAQDPNHVIFKLSFDEKDRQKMIKILTNG